MTLTLSAIRESQAGQTLPPRITEFVDAFGSQWRLAAKFFVPGDPAGAGSKTALPIMRNGKPLCGNNGRPIFNMVEAKTDKGRAKTKNWRSAVSLMARASYRGEPLDCAVRLDIDFYLPRIKAHYFTGSRAGIIRPNAPAFQQTKPDRDKLMRSTGDALTGIIYIDDSRVCAGEVRKLYGDESGAYITVWRICETIQAHELEAAKCPTLLP